MFQVSCLLALWLSHCNRQTVLECQKLHVIYLFVMSLKVIVGHVYRNITGRFILLVNLLLSDNMTILRL